MNTTAAPTPPSVSTNALLPIAVGGLVAGTLDLTQALLLFGSNTPQVIAAGLLGRQVIHDGGPFTYALGVGLHYFIATTATAIYYTASRRLTFLREHPVVCGPFYGIAVELVMRLVVLPLSALHSKGPYKHEDLALGLVVHMALIGLPIALSIRRFSR